MDWATIAGFLQPELFIVIVFLYCIGLFLKKNGEFQNKYIPIVLLGLSIVITILFLIVNKGFSVSGVLTGIIQGTIIAAVTVFGNEIIKQIGGLK